MIEPTIHSHIRSRLSIHHLRNPDCFSDPFLRLFPGCPDMAKTCIYAAIVVCICTATSHAYRLVGSEALSEALVAHHYTINDRLDAVIVVDRTIPTFEYQTFYAMGSADEPEGKQGELHFLEHIIADGGSRPPGELAELIGANGGQYHATTDLNFTNFRLRFPRDKLAVAVEIDRDGFYSTLINNEVVEKQRQVVLTELSRNLARTSRRFSSQFWALVYGRGRFEGVGTVTLIRELTPGDLRQLFHNVVSKEKASDRCDRRYRSG